MKRFRGGLVFKAHRLCVSLNSRLESNKEEEGGCVVAAAKPGHKRDIEVEAPSFNKPFLAPRKVDVRLPGEGSSNSHGARPVHLIITRIMWIRTSRLSKKTLALSPGTNETSLHPESAPIADLSRVSWGGSKT